MRDPEGEPIRTRIIVSGAPGLRVGIDTGERGEFLVTLPYGHYALRFEDRRISPQADISIDVHPLQIESVALTIDVSGNVHLQLEAENNPGVWAGSARAYPEAFNFSGILLAREPSTATRPLNFAGLGDNRRAWISQRGFSWTGTEFNLMGMNATDSFQPGRPLILPNVNSLDEIVTRSGFAQITSHAYASDIGFFASQPSSAWHGYVATSDTGAALASSNLPSIPDRGTVQQTGRYRWFTREDAQAGGALAKWADLFLAGGGQWASQTIPIAAPGNNLDSRILFGDARLRARAGPRDQFDLLYSGSRMNLFDWGLPAGLEVLSGQRMAVSFASPYGFQNEAEADQFTFLQIGWNHTAPDAIAGALQARYQYSIAHLDTTPLNGLGQSRIELLDASVTAAAPLANDATETRQQVSAFWEPTALSALRLRHRLVIGGSFETSSPTNRFTTPSDMNIIAAAGAPAFSVQFNTPANSRSIVRASSLTLADHLVLQDGLSLDLGAMADFARGSLPRQFSAGGSFAAPRSVAAEPGLIAWNHISPRAAFAWRVPHANNLVVRGGYFRVYVPIAGRYLDFANPNSLGGSEYQWLDRNTDGLFEPGELGPLVLRFGGPYSSISPSLSRPYADEFDVGAEFSPMHSLTLRMNGFRRDDKRRIAAVNNGLATSAFSAISIRDPGPDGIADTFDDQQLTVYAQDPATFGQDRYVLTNPPKLRMLNKGLEADARVERQSFFVNASFVAEESYGPTNPGDAVFENDPGVAGALYMDPNTLVNASGRGVMDRAFLGKVQGMYRLPLRIEFAGIIDYLDGLVFARQLLVTGLAQGPFVMNATSRGTQLNNPLSGNRAEGVINGNIRVAREFRLPSGSLTASVDVFNVANSGYKIQENESSATTFNQRLPVEIQPARFVRMQVRLSF